ncbi:MAG: hypothetical protein HZB42_03095 [Sphingobacteriales bacterium]|nr:hypothetical protein [Sphingobacteriales bacterium]
MQSIGKGISIAEGSCVVRENTETRMTRVGRMNTPARPVRRGFYSASQNKRDKKKNVVVHCFSTHPRQGGAK